MHLGVGDLNEIVVPRAHGDERFGRDGADDFVDDVLKRLAGLDRSDRHGGAFRGTWMPGTLVRTNDDG